MKKKGFKEERVTTMRLDANDTSTTLESNKSLLGYHYSGMYTPESLSEKSS